MFIVTIKVVDVWYSSGWLHLLCSCVYIKLTSLTIVYKFTFQSSVVDTTVWPNV